MYYGILTIHTENQIISIKKFIPFIEVVMANDNSRLSFFNQIRNYMIYIDEEVRKYSINIFANLIFIYIFESDELKCFTILLF